jgi:hypothetical protein
VVPGVNAVSSSSIAGRWRKNGRLQSCSTTANTFEPSESQCPLPGADHAALGSANDSAAEGNTTRVPAVARPGVTWKTGRNRGRSRGQSKARQQVLPNRLLSCPVSRLLTTAGQPSPLYPVQQSSSSPRTWPGSCSTPSARCRPGHQLSDVTTKEPSRQSGAHCQAPRCWPGVRLIVLHWGWGCPRKCLRRMVHKLTSEGSRVGCGTEPRVTERDRGWECGDLSSGHGFRPQHCPPRDHHKRAIVSAQGREGSAPASASGKE